MESIDIKKISNTFSKGDLRSVYKYFDDKFRWSIIGSPEIIGKENAIAHCNNMLLEMMGSHMNNTNLIITDDTAVVQGYCSYLNHDNTPGKVEYCDIYRYQNNKLVDITSYIIESKNVK